jgi:thiol:disulfide interchange protein
MLLIYRRERGWVTVAVAAIPLVVVPIGALQRQYDAPAATNEGLLDTQPFSEAALAEARASGKPVFVWFTADWCLTCKVNESVAIERAATKAAFEEAGVIALVGDWTRRDPAITRFLTEQGAAGVPLYLWYPAGGEVRQLPQVLTPDSLVSLAKQAAAATAGPAAGTTRSAVAGAGFPPA